MESEEVGELFSVGGVLVDSELEVLRELLIEFLVVLLVFSDLGEHLEALLHNVLLDDLEDSVLLEGLSGDVEREIIGVNYTLDEGEPLWDEVLAVVHDEDSSDVELEVVLLLFVLEEIEWGSLWNEEEGGELELTLNVEVLDREVLFPVVGEGLVEGDVLILGDVLWLSHPDWLGLVEDLVLMGDFLDLLLLFLLWLLVILDLWLLIILLLVITLLLLFVLLVFLLVVRVGDLLVGGLFNHELDWEANEFGVLFDQVLQLSLLEELLLVLLQLQNDLGSSGHVTGGVWVDGESSTGVGLPDVLLVSVVLGDNSDLLGNEISGVETNTELTDHADVGTGGDGLHETSGSGVVHEVALGHTNTSVVDGQGVVGLVWDDLDS